MKYSKKTRQLAAEICSYAANNEEFRQNYAAVAYHLEIPVDGPASGLAFAAWQKVVDFRYNNCLGEAFDEVVDAEAEALIRSGGV